MSHMFKEQSSQNTGIDRFRKKVRFWFLLSCFPAALFVNNVFSQEGLRMIGTDFQKLFVQHSALTEQEIASFLVRFVAPTLFAWLAFEAAEYNMEHLKKILRREHSTVSYTFIERYVNFIMKFLFERSPLP